MIWKACLRLYDVLFSINSIRMLVPKRCDIFVAVVRRYWPIMIMMTRRLVDYDDQLEVTSWEFVESFHQCIGTLKDHALGGDNRTRISKYSDLSLVERHDVVNAQSLPLAGLADCGLLSRVWLWFRDQKVSWAVRQELNLFCHPIIESLLASYNENSRE